ncbi:MAG: tyrosine-protein phosphatase [Clostridia bacterium]|nr:tyrosine-protein phosphatase [Clostridia bacterium]
MVRLLSPKNGETVSQKTEVMKLFEKDIEANASVWGWVAFAADSDGICTVPEPVRFSWDGSGGDGMFVLSENEDLSDPVCSCRTGSRFDAYNLLLGKRYYWRAGDSETGSFVTDRTPPRWIRADGTWNVRDIGGYDAAGGNRVRQGMIFRGMELDCEKNNNYLTENGRAVLHDQLGIRCDFDLRSHRDGNEFSGKSPIGPDVRYIRIGIDPYCDFYKDAETVRRVFAVLADPDNYPMYIHCSWGSDRTGTLAAAVETLLGMDDEDICADYEQSTLAFPDCHRDRGGWTWQLFYKEMEEFGANSFDRFYNRTIVCGVPREHIEALQGIMLENR